MFGPLSGAHFNPAVTIARSFTDTFSDVIPANAPAFIAAQLVGAASATLVFAWLLRPMSETQPAAPDSGA